MEKTKVAILGATGSVGQKFIELLLNHPWFEIAELAASERSAGKTFGEATNWVMHTPLPDKIRDTIVILSSPESVKSKVVFSAMDASVAGPIEEEFARNGHVVISNARNHRYDADVPLIIPEVNYEHLAVLEAQNYKGCIITNPNCSTIGLTLALKPLQDKFGIEAVNIVTMQAISGAGYPGLSAMDMIDNVVPFIGGEEAKMEIEPLKILGNLIDNKFVNAEIKISAQCNRVSVIDGHLECVQIKLKKKASIEEVKKAFVEFTSEPQRLELPSAPKPPIKYFEEENYPQPKLHRNLGKGMTVSVGRLRECSLFDYKFVVLSHNTIRGAAGGTILIAEMLKSKNII
ncbi:MAG: aspartate-semialdehyde dehydrogenase [Bacteroidetes bacterium]|nr:aspartate-semialdehyde dehydrogenase [Bacteroidota bacterium]